MFVQQSHLFTSFNFLVQETLTECMKNKFKKERQPLTGIEDIQAMRKKYSRPGSGRKRSGLQDESDILSRKVHKVSIRAGLFCETGVFH
jgi:hypothetical protein